MMGCSVRAGADGEAYALGDQDDDHRVLVRISPDGREIKTIAEDRAVGGPLQRGDRHLALSPSGTIAVAGENGSVKIFDREGRVLSTHRVSRRSGLAERADLAHSATI
jgi:hypothetical protein